MTTGFKEIDWPAGEWRKAKGVKIASGEGFIASVSVASEITAGSGAVAVEMNAFGLMGAVAGRPVEMLVLRVVSDRAGGARRPERIARKLSLRFRNPAPVSDWKR